MVRECSRIVEWRDGGVTEGPRGEGARVVGRRERAGCARVVVWRERGEGVRVVWRRE